MITHQHPAILSIALVLALAACAGDTQTQAPQFDAGAPPDAEEAPDVDPADTAKPEASCLDILVTDTNFHVDPRGPNIQIHPAAAFDGLGVWIVYNLPEEVGGGFDVHAVRLGCDGKALAGPMRINTTTEHNDTDPTLSVGSESLMTTWITDDGNFPNNLHTYVRGFTLDGQPLRDTDRRIETTRGGEPQVANTWMPDLTALNDGRFVMAGARGLAEAERFQVYLQTLTKEGDNDGEAVDGQFEALITQLTPAVAATPAGDLFVAWTRSTDEMDSERIVHTRLDADAEAPEPPVSLAVGPADLPSLALSPDGQRAYLAFHGTSEGDLQVFIKDAEALSPDAPVLTLGDRGELDHTTEVAAFPTSGGAVAWYQIIRGFRNRLLIQRFDDADGTLSAPSPSLTVPTDGPAAPYQPALTCVTDGVCLLAWAEGTSPDFRIKARFVDLR